MGVAHAHARAVRDMHRTLTQSSPLAAGPAFDAGTHHHPPASALYSISFLTPNSPSHSHTRWHTHYLEGRSPSDTLEGHVGPVVSGALRPALRARQWCHWRRHHRRCSACAAGPCIPNSVETQLHTRKHPLSSATPVLPCGSNVAICSSHEKAISPCPRRPTRPLGDHARRRSPSGRRASRPSTA